MSGLSTTFGMSEPIIILKLLKKKRNKESKKVSYLCSQNTDVRITQTQTANFLTNLGLGGG